MVYARSKALSADILLTKKTCLFVAGSGSFSEGRATTAVSDA